MLALLQRPQVVVHQSRQHHLEPRRHERLLLLQRKELQVSLREWEQQLRRTRSSLLERKDAEKEPRQALLVRSPPPPKPKVTDMLLRQEFAELAPTVLTGKEISKSLVNRTTRALRQRHGRVPNRGR